MLQKTDHKLLLNELPSEDELKKQIMLTSTIAWKNNLTSNEIENWLENFKGEVFPKDEERKLALLLLVNFVYYNLEEVHHLCKTLFRDFIHEMLIENNDKKTDINSSIRNILNNTIFYHSGRSGESSAFILYLFRQANNLPLDSFINDPTDIQPNISNVVFIDDVTLSKGLKNQAFEYITGTDRYFHDKKKILLTFIATNDAIKTLNDNGILVISCINLDKRNQCFSEHSDMFSYFDNCNENCKKFAEHYGRKLMPNNPLGWDNCQFIFGFFYNTPDNTLPIFWSDNNGWYPIIKRYQKNYKGEFINLGRFV